MDGLRRAVGNPFAARRPGRGRHIPRRSCDGSLVRSVRSYEVEPLVTVSHAQAHEKDVPVQAQECLAPRPSGYLSAARSAEDEGDQGSTQHGARYHAFDASTASAPPRKALAGPCSDRDLTRRLQGLPAAFAESRVG
jgi:hypothetical protein